MESFGARTDLPIDVCLKAVRESDVLVVIVAHRYGELVPNQDVSFSQAEYQEGYSLAKPCLVYLLDEKTRVSLTSYESDPQKIPLLKNYKALLQKRHTPMRYKNSADLGTWVAADLVRTAGIITRGVLTPVAQSSSSIFLNTAQLAELQNDSFKEIWVYAPLPLETLQNGAHSGLRTRVFANLMAGVKYRYFVESEAGISRIMDLICRMAKEIPSEAEALTKLKMCITVVVLTPADFLTYYTLHHRPNSEIEVFQSNITPDRDDSMVRVQEPHASLVFSEINKRMEAMQVTTFQGIQVLRPCPAMGLT